MNYTSLALNLGIQGIIHNEEYAAKCPFHHDSSPSFYMNTKTGLCICHRGCFQGTFIQLIERVLNCSVYEAYEWIQNNGRSTSYEDLSKDIGKRIKAWRPGILNEVLSEEPKPWLAVYDFINNNSMPTWFLDRGFTWECINHWNLKYHESMDAVVIPVNWQGEMVGTITRQHYGTPKYLNSRFEKSKLVFGEIMPNQNYIILVEGPLDAIWLWQLGYNSVSTLGAWCSGEQVNWIKRNRYGEVVLALDNDEAGKAGTKDAVKKLVASGYLLPQISVIRFPGKNGEEGYKKDAQDCDLELFSELFKGRKGVIG